MLLTRKRPFYVVLQRDISAMFASKLLVTKIHYAGFFPTNQDLPISHSFIISQPERNYLKKVYALFFVFFKSYYFRVMLGLRNGRKIYPQNVLSFIIVKGTIGVL